MKVASFEKADRRRPIHHAYYWASERLRMAELAIDREFDRRASLRIDRALVELESFGKLLQFKSRVAA